MSESLDEWKTLLIREITSLHDAALPGALDIYQRSFPLEEQELVSFFLNTLTQKETRASTPFHFDVLANEQTVAGFAFYEIGREVEGIGRGGYLWYLASHPDIRAAGIGTRLYQHVRDTMFAHYGCRACFFEIEDSADALQRHGQHAADYAEWRKAWYKRRGALELRGTHYLCGGGWQPAIPMQIMVHPNGLLLPADALSLARAVQNESIAVVGELELV